MLEEFNWLKLRRLRGVEKQGWKEEAGGRSC